MRRTTPTGLLSPARVTTLTVVAASVIAAFPLLRSCLIDGQTTIFELSLVEGLARLTALIGVRHFDEAEPPRLPGLAIPDKVH